MQMIVLFIYCLKLGLFNFIMIIGFQKEDITNWKNDLSRYQQRKRGQLLLDEQRQKLFLPIKNHKRSHSKAIDSLQRYQSAQLPSKAKEDKKQEVDRALKKYMYQRFNHQKQYDIISNYPLGGSMIQSEFEKQKKNHAPIRNLYNIINGQKLAEQYLKNRRILLPIHHQKKEVDKSRQFNIVNLQYKKDNQLRLDLQIKEKREELINKYKNTHTYDKIYSRYYNPQEEDRYWVKKNEENFKNVSHDFQSKLPPSYQYRQRYIQDLSKPLPKKVQQLDKVQQKKRQAHQAKYVFQAKKTLQNIEEAQRAEERVFNRIRNIKDLKSNKSSFASSNIKERKDALDSAKIKSYGFGQN